MAVVATAVFWPDIPNWCLLFVCFVVGGAALAEAWFRCGTLSLKARKADANSSLSLLSLVGSLALALKAMNRFELVDWQWPVVVSIALGLPLSTAIAIGLRKGAEGKFGTVFLACFFCIAGPGTLVWSSLLFANDFTGARVIENYKVQIAKKKSERGKYETRYWIEAKNYPNLNGIFRFRTNRTTYEMLNFPGTACIRVLRGSLYIRRYVVEAC